MGISGVCRAVDRDSAARIAAGSVVTALAMSALGYYRPTVRYWTFRASVVSGTVGALAALRLCMTTVTPPTLQELEGEKMLLWGEMKREITTAEAHDDPNNVELLNRHFAVGLQFSERTLDRIEKLLRDKPESDELRDLHPSEPTAEEVPHLQLFKVARHYRNLRYFIHFNEETSSWGKHSLAQVYATDTFYTEGTVQNRWRLQYNAFCERLEKVGELRGEYRYWFTPDTPEDRLTFFLPLPARDSQRPLTSLANGQEEILSQLQPLLKDRAGFANPAIWSLYERAFDMAELRFEYYLATRTDPALAKDDIDLQVDLLAVWDLYVRVRSHCTYEDGVWSYEEKAVNGPLARPYYEKGTKAYSFRKRYNAYCARAKPYLDKPLSLDLKA